MRLLLTRPRAQSTRTAHALEALGHTCVIEPLLSVEALANPEPTLASNAMAFTSANAVSCLPDGFSQRHGQTPVFTTGSATQLQAYEAGFENVVSAQGAGTDLARLIVQQAKAQDISTVLYPCADQKAVDLTALLAREGISCAEWPVYRMVETRTFSPYLTAAFDTAEIDGVLLFSSRTARCFARLVAKGNLPLHGLKVFALSDAIRNNLSEVLRDRCFVAEQPNEQALLALLGRVSV